MKIGANIALLIAGQAALSLLSQIVVVHSLGASDESDLFFILQTVPVILASILAAGLQSSWLPEFVRNPDAQKTQIGLGKALGQSVVLSFAFSLPLWSTIEFWHPLLFPLIGIQQDTNLLLMSIPAYLAILSSSVLCVTIVSVRAMARFVLAEGALFIGAFCTLLLVLFLVPRYEIHGALWAVFSKNVVATIFLFLLGTKPSLTIKDAFAESRQRDLLRVVTSASCLFKLTPLFDRYLLAMSNSGTLTIFVLSQSLVSFSASTLERIFATPELTKLSKLAYKLDLIEIRHHYRRFIAKQILIIASAYTVVILAATLIGSLSKYWALTSIDFNILIFYALCMFGYMIVSSTASIISGIFYATGDAKTPTKIGVACFLGALPLKSALYVGYGATGLAIGISLHYLTSMAAMIFALEKRIKNELP